MAVAGGTGDGEGVGPVASVQMSHEKSCGCLGGDSLFLHLASGLRVQFEDTNG